MSDWNDAIVKEFRENDGRVGGPFEGAHLVVITTTGAKSGLPRVSPVMPFQKDDTVYVVASKAGADENPAWYHNMIANATVGVELSTDAGIDTFEATAIEVPLERHDSLYAEIVAEAPGFGEYQAKTSRVIPIVELRRR